MSMLVFSRNKQIKKLQLVDAGNRILYYFYYCVYACLVLGTVSALGQKLQDQHNG